MDQPSKKLNLNCKIFLMLCEVEKLYQMTTFRLKLAFDGKSLLTLDNFKPFSNISPSILRFRNSSCASIRVQRFSRALKRPPEALLSSLKFIDKICSYYPDKCPIFFSFWKDILKIDRLVLVN